MTNHILLFGIILTLFGNTSCSNPKSGNETKQPAEISDAVEKHPKKETPAPATRKTLTEYLPPGFVIFQEVYGDLNNDGREDCAIIIKATDKNYIVTDKEQGTLDRNRRGIIVLLNKDNSYELAAKNHTCFSSENEDGGVYFAPELYVTINKNNLYIEYAHGRYGFWKYTFRYKNSDFELIGYDASENHGPVVMRETSINFLTGKKITKTNTNDHAEGGDEIFEKTETMIKPTKLTKLSHIKDFDGLEISKD
jgi:hypothetical protein